MKDKYEKQYLEVAHRLNNMLTANTKQEAAEHYENVLHTLVKVFKEKVEELEK